MIKLLHHFISRLVLRFTPHKIITISNLNYQITSRNPNEVAITGGANIPKNLTIPSSIHFNDNKFMVTCIKAKAFKGKDLLSVCIPNTVLSIGAEAFIFNNLQSVEIPESVACIGNDAFRSNPNLNLVVCLNSIPPKLEGAYVFSNTSTTINLTTPADSLSTYKNAGWVGFH